MSVLAFDLETVPDIPGSRRIQAFEGLDDDDVARALAAQRRQQTGGSEFMRLHLHRIVAISVAGHVEGRFRVWSLGHPGDEEATLLQRFFDGIERYSPTLVSWNGSGFDIPVLQHRALIHGLTAPRYWETGERDPSFRFNNYLNRYHQRHTDLMDLLAGHQVRAAAPLDEMALLCGLPGKMGMSGGEVAEAVADGRIQEVRNYCETDVLNTYLLYLRFQHLRGALDTGRWEAACDEVAGVLAESEPPHLQAFLEAWRGA